MHKVVKVVVNEAEGKEPEQYFIKDLNINFQNLTATAVSASDTYINHPQVGGPSGAYTQPQTPYSGGTRFSHAQNESVIDAEHVVHISLTEGLDLNWPFGTSILESVFKIFKQKELLEDAVIIYRIQRAPERRIFKIDVGNMPTHMAMAYVDRIKNEIHQRRIPTQSGGGTNMMDATYNPLSTNEDYFFPVTADGRGSSIDVFPGGQNLGEITDLRFFTNKLFRALRIPAAYLPTGIEESANTVADGKVGTAYIQELRFNEYCKRLQSMIVETFDLEFKLWLYHNGINIDSSVFELKFNTPQNFAAYRQAEMDNARISTFTALQESPYISKRFALKRFLGLTQEEITENESLWREENGAKLSGSSEASGEMRDIGVNPGAMGAEVAGQEEEASPDMAAAAEAGAVEGGDAAAAPPAQ
jgi:hypothetical protein